MPARLFFPTLGLLALTSCSSPPKPPSVDPSNRHPANAAAAVELQVCKNDLHNTRALATESGRLAESTSATLNNLVARQKTLTVLRGMDTPSAASNSVYTVRFAFGSSRVDIPVEAARTLIDQARTAPLILLRGRTDGTSDSAAESHVARDRAAMVRDYLVAGGVDPARIRATYQPIGDPIADNGNDAGRSLNRRVEIEIYRAPPVTLTSTSATP